MAEPIALEGAGRVEEMESISAEEVQNAKRTFAEMQLASDPNNLYQQCFQLLKMGGLAAEIPRLVVFGQQSMGKTTLLDYIMGGPIGYSSTTTGTKHPVVILIKAQEPHEEGGPIRACIDGVDMDIAQMQDAMRKIMESTETISDKEVTVELRVPGGVSALFVDLPGIKDDSKEGADLTRSVVRNYVRSNPHDLYVLVKKASDDPANWPYQLRDFILKDPPKGLGLKARQTMVVGTRALDFLKGEKNDVGTHSQLLKRVKDRAVPDPSGVTLPLFLLELFSLERHLKDSDNFEAKRKSMFSQIAGTRAEIYDILNASFTADRADIKKELFNHFDIDLFKRTLNDKFQNLLGEQLGSLEKRLFKKRITLLSQIAELQTQVQDKKAQSCREFIKLFCRELMTRVNELVTGNYNHVILRSATTGANASNQPGGKQAAEEFLETWGGNLEDNLRDGHALACDIFKSEMYDRNFIEKVLPPEACLKNQASMDGHQPAITNSEYNNNSTTSGQHNRQSTTSNFPHSTLRNPPTSTTAAATTTGSSNAQQQSSSAARPAVHPLVGKEIRVDTKGKTLYAKVIEVPTNMAGNNPNGNANDQRVCLADFGARDEGFNTKNNKNPATTQATVATTRSPPEFIRPVQIADTTVIVKCSDNLDLITAALTERDKNKEHAPLKLWFPRPAPTKPSSSSDAADSSKNYSVMMMIGVDLVALVRSDGKNQPLDLTDPSSVTAVVRAPHGPNQFTEVSSRIDSLFIDAKDISADMDSVDILSGVNSSDLIGPVWMNPGSGAGRVPSLYQIAGDYAETKLLNQLSITHLGRWLKFHIGTLEPDRSLPEKFLLQMMRSVQNVVDKSDWEPAVADMLQMNIKGGFLYLVRLASCATAVALRRILRAAIHETCRMVMCDELPSSLQFLAENSKFCAELEVALDEYCTRKAQRCADNMRDFIFEQTHALHFEMIEDFFTGCDQFERDFLPGENSMRSVIHRVREDIMMRKKRLGMTDIYSRASSQPSMERIHEEVRIHFWVTKMLLAAPLTTKLYMSFVKDVKDRAPHLASEGTMGYSSESVLERYLQDRLLCDTTISTAVSTSTGEDMQVKVLSGRTDDDLAKYFDLDLKKNVAAEKMERLRRVLEYVNVAVEGVGKLRAAVSRSEGGVDFLMKLDKSLGAGGGKVKATAV
eukprot:GDKJ01036950.1.p1 GENE.GDKJ01036950.1~~GDKJ01036950.1.p1  ORF type:complete len:1171 (-),score=297.26 GDKJ01036950.1:64-3576(-)